MPSWRYARVVSVIFFVGKSAKQMEMSIAVITSSVIRSNRATSNVSSGVRNLSRLMLARLHDELSRWTYSEYVHLDNSSCNLASINLLKFLTPEDTFDVARFERITELVITAMDISICFADFPTKKITETTRAYRQLGIGYANLG